MLLKGKKLWEREEEKKITFAFHLCTIVSSVVAYSWAQKREWYSHSFWKVHFIFGSSSLNSMYKNNLITIHQAFYHTYSNTVPISVLVCVWIGTRCRYLYRCKLNAWCLNITVSNGSIHSSLKGRNHMISACILSFTIFVSNVKWHNI